MARNKSRIRIPSGMRAVKAITIARVSSDDQEQFSPAAQTRRMKEYCLRSNLRILESFEITESSTQGDRKAFMAIIDRAAKTAKKLGEPVAIVADKVDRLQRGFKHQHILEELRESGVLEYHFSSDNCVVHRNSPATDLFSWNISVALAKNYTDTLRDNVNRAREQKLASGEWISQAPIGYLNWRDDSIKRHGRGKAEIKLDEVRAPLVAKLFEKYATGCYSLSQIVGYAKSIGLTNSRGKQGYLCKSHIHSILNEPFYYGVMRVKGTGEEFPHIYETIITKTLFDQCQDVLKGRSRPHARYGGKEFLFRGLITCQTSGKLCTSESHERKYKNGGGKTFTYLTSRKPDNPAKLCYTREEDVLSQIEDALERLAIGNKAILRDVMSIIMKAVSERKSEGVHRHSALQCELAELDRKLDRLTELRLEDELTREEFQSKKKRLADRRQDVQELIQNTGASTNDTVTKLKELVEFAATAAEIFKGSDFHGKREILSLVFQNLQLNGKNLSYSMHTPFATIAECNKTGEWCGLVDAIGTHCQHDILPRTWLEFQKKPPEAA